MLCIDQLVYTATCSFIHVNNKINEIMEVSNEHPPPYYWCTTFKQNIKKFQKRPILSTNFNL